MFSKILRYVVSVKSMVKISSIFVAFLENMNSILVIMFTLTLPSGVLLSKMLMDFFFHNCYGYLASV